MKEKLARIFSSKKSTNRAIAVIAVFIVATLASIYTISHSYYVREDSSLLISGSVSIPSKADITLKVYIQDRDTSGNPVANSYSRVYFIPQTDYSYNESKTSCTEGVAISGFTNYEFEISASQVGTCEVYFDALASDNISSSPNGAFRIFIQEEAGSEDYIEVGEVPSRNSYVVNETLTGNTCTGVSLVDGKIEVVSSGNVACNIYLDLAS